MYVWREPGLQTSTITRPEERLRTWLTLARDRSGPRRGRGVDACSDPKRRARARPPRKPSAAGVRLR
eukprot:CAMPEP_0195065630 /NCGR_PEP_ID=MMETSP0448-20130528/11234_1 /TAXON_ID=66468 /ORGANISM="Heterocapsa triquestra, Strain CCMP 448" /LENGTH=66 /DNA_ID=CAMNT_0040096755 /DNA_START=67 /DNA_END=264 /DNA_ORIENTATION=+